MVVVGDKSSKKVAVGVADRKETLKEILQPQEGGEASGEGADSLKLASGTVTGTVASNGSGGGGRSLPSKGHLKFNSVPMVAPKWLKSGFSEGTLWTTKTKQSQLTQQQQQQQ